MLQPYVTKEEEFFMNGIQPLNTSVPNKAISTQNNLKNDTIALLTNTNSLKQTIENEFKKIEGKESESTVSKNTEKADYCLAWVLQI